MFERTSDGALDAVLEGFCLKSKTIAVIPESELEHVFYLRTEESTSSFSKCVGRSY